MECMGSWWVDWGSWRKLPCMECMGHAVHGKCAAHIVDWLGAPHPHQVRRSASRHWCHALRCTWTAPNCPCEQLCTPCQVKP